MKYLGVCRQPNVPNTTRKRSGFADWKAKLRQVRSLKEFAYREGKADTQVEREIRNRLPVS